MKECLVDVLNDRGTVLHVFPIPVEDQNGTPKAVDPEHEGAEGPNAQKRTVRNENTDNFTAIPGKNSQVHSVSGMNWLFAACNHGVQQTLHAIS